MATASRKERRQRKERRGEKDRKERTEEQENEERKDTTRVRSLASRLMAGVRQTTSTMKTTATTMMAGMSQPPPGKTLAGLKMTTAVMVGSSPNGVANNNYLIISSNQSLKHLLLDYLIFRLLPQAISFNILLGLLHEQLGTFKARKVLTTWC